MIELFTHFGTEFAELIYDLVRVGDKMSAPQNVEFRMKTAHPGTSFDSNPKIQSRERGIPGAAGWQLDRRQDGTILVRVKSHQPAKGSIPDAVFTFRVGDPQYEYWAEQWQLEAPSAGMTS